MITENKDFYPTPDNLIEKMTAGIDFRYVQSILEPSAGSGNIVDWLMKNKQGRYTYSQNRYEYEVDCIEIDETLKSTLKGKGYRVIYNDFLSFNTYKKYDLIIANFPFSNGCKHLLKAMEMQKEGGCIVALINAETLRNPFSNERQFLLAELQEANAEITYINSAFCDAERKTDVEVAMVKIIYPEKKQDSFIFDGLKKAKEQREVEYQETNYVANADLFKAIVEQYNLEIEAGIKLIKEYWAMVPYMKSDFKKNEEGVVEQSGDAILKLRVDGHDATINTFIKEVRKKYWDALFHNPKFTGQLTENLRTEFYKRVDEMQNYDFNLYNIYELKIEMSKNVVKGIEDTIVNLFEEMSNKYHYYDETSKNIHYFNGWKTNKSYIINNKIVLPLNAWHGYYQKYDPACCYEGPLRKLQDIEKCFNFLDGGMTEAVDLEATLKEAQETEVTKNIKLKYFTITFYKKGTCHITFTNLELLKKFNIFGAQHKGWLPPCYGKAHYSEMNSEEKSVVKGFDGNESEYENVVSASKYYIVNSNDFLLAVNE